MMDIAVLVQRNLFKAVWLLFSRRLTSHWQAYTWEGLGQGNASIRPDHLSVHQLGVMEVPVIDLSRGSDSEVAAAVADACKSVGFFYVTGHGVSEQLISDVFRTSKELFSLPVEDKQTFAQDKNNRGWTPFKEEILDPANQKHGDTKESFYMGREIPETDPEASKPLHGPNNWPAEALVPGFRKTFEEYFQECMRVANKMISILALSLGLPASYFEPYFTHPTVVVRPMHYDAVESKPEEGVFGAGAHCDYGMLTLLLTDEVPGLQIHVNGKWMDVPPKPNHFIVNLGDMLERWTNGMYRSTLHRVVTGNQHRYSVACFFEPNSDAVVECLPQCCTPERPAAYPPTTAGQYLLDKYAVTHYGYTGPLKVQT